MIPARLMLRDLSNGSLVTLATDNGIVAQGEIVSNRLAISPDGLRVAFVSSSSSLVPGDSNARPDVFVRDLASGATLLGSSTSEGVPASPVVSGGLSYYRPRGWCSDPTPETWFRHARLPTFFRSTRRSSPRPQPHCSDPAEADGMANQKRD